MLHDTPDRVIAVLTEARKLAERGYTPDLIEMVLRSEGFKEAPDVIWRSAIYRELTDTAARARRRREAERAIRESGSTP